MGLHYLFDYFDTDLASSKIDDVILTTEGISSCTGSFVVRVPFDIPVKNPEDLDDLIVKKFQGFLLHYPGFTRIAYDNLLDIDHIALSDPEVRGVFGKRNVVGIEPGAKFVSQSISLVGAPADRAFIMWEAYDYPDDNSWAMKYTRNYRELETDLTCTCSVSFDNGAHYNTIKSRRVLSIIQTEQGTDFIIKIQNITTQRIYIGSWAVVY